jgi:hypothetical protein
LSRILYKVALALGRSSSSRLHFEVELFEYEVPLGRLLGVASAHFIKCRTGAAGRIWAKDDFAGPFAVLFTD